MIHFSKLVLRSEKVDEPGNRSFATVRFVSPPVWLAPRLVLSPRANFKSSSRVRSPRSPNRARNLSEWMEVPFWWNWSIPLTRLWFTGKGSLYISSYIIPYIISLYISSSCLLITYSVNFIKILMPVLFSSTTSVPVFFFSFLKRLVERQYQLYSWLNFWVRYPRQKLRLLFLWSWCIHDDSWTCRESAD